MKAYSLLLRGTNIKLNCIAWLSQSHPVTFSPPRRLLSPLQKRFPIREIRTMLFLGDRKPLDNSPGGACRGRQCDELHRIHDNVYRTD